MLKKMALLQVLLLILCNLSMYTAEPRKSYIQALQHKVSSPLPLQRLTKVIQPPQQWQDLLPPAKRIRPLWDAPQYAMHDQQPQNAAPEVDPKNQSKPSAQPSQESPLVKEDILLLLSCDVLQTQSAAPQQVAPEIDPKNQSKPSAQPSQESPLVKEDIPLLLSCDVLQTQSAAPQGPDTLPLQEQKCAEHVIPQAAAPLHAQLQTKSYFNTQIVPVIKDLMSREEGKIYGAYYLANSKQLLDWWILRKYMQEYEKAKQHEDTKALLEADKYKNSPKEDILIVDKEATAKKHDKLKELAASGIQVLVRKKPRKPDNQYQIMHFKFLIFFHKDKPEQGKLAITGSFNMTNQADTYNWEDIIVLYDPETIAQYIEQHMQLRQYCEPL